MGEIADMMLDGTLCEGCGTYIGSDAGYPVRCAACRGDDSDIDPFTKIPCQICGKKVKAIGLMQHKIDKHGGVL